MSERTNKSAFDRRSFLKNTAIVGFSSAGFVALGAISGCETFSGNHASASASAKDFVSVDGQHFKLGGKPYRYVGANMWYSPYAASPASNIGNPGRIERELDALKEIGITNVRLLGSGEVSPLNNSLNPAIQNADGTVNEALLIGLDKTLAEMGKRGMKAVIYLTNFWEWSGGMGTYLARANGGHFLNMNDPAHPWPEFPDFVSGFYENNTAMEAYRHYVRSLVGRTNSVTGMAYKDDPTIQAWQLCNEPRPAGSEAMANQKMAAYLRWIQESARLIKSLDSNHLVSVGHEGLKGCIESAQCVANVHAFPEVDYVTCHIWPQNWSWTNNADLPAGFARVAEETSKYIQFHENLAKELGKPLVIEEFGYPRDNTNYDAGTPTRERDRFYGLILDAVEHSAAENGPISGINFWAWGGEGRPLHDDHHMRPGETAYVGDPPHEPQGWYSVFNNDTSTIALLRAHAARLNR